MEACGSSHYWAREIRALGHEVVLIPPAYTKPYVKRGKNDANDAAAICEAMSRPEMRFVPIKSADQQAVLMLHKTRELLVKQRTMAVNALRGHLSEFGLIAPRGIQRVKDLLELALADETLPEEARQATAMLASHGEDLDERIDDLEKKSPEPAGETRQAGRWMKSPLSARSSHRRSPPSLPIQASSGREAISVLRWALLRARIRAAARTSSAESPRRATDICARCRSWGAHRCCAWPTNTKAPWPNGSSP
jgi:hypothetical protein